MRPKFIMTVFAWTFMFVAGVLCGGAAVGFFWWAYATVVQEESLDPLADLHIPAGPLSGEQVKAYVQQLGEQYRTQNAACLMIAVIVRDEDRYFPFGTLPGGTAPDADTLFELASVGKTMTGLLLADMIHRQEVTAETTVESLLPPSGEQPWFGGTSISLFDLATQSSGLASVPGNMPAANPLNPYADYTVPLMYEELRSAKLAFVPGRGYAYSNLGFGLLGHALTLKAGTDFESLVIQRICDPLGMTDTRMTLSEEQRARIAPPHDDDHAVEVWEDVTMAGAGSFLSSARDLTRYLRAYWSSPDVSMAAALALCIKKHRKTDTPQTAIGYGWHINSENALDMIWHNGGSGGSRSYVGMLPDRQIGVVVLANWAQANVDELGRKLVYLMAKQETHRQL
jgi:serine-type D-Ala-D-Ala carboxypeptidase/endopeptidase